MNDKEPASTNDLDLETLQAGDLVEVRNAKVGDIAIGDLWMPAVVGEDEATIEIDMPDDARPGNRAGAPLAARIEELLQQSAEIRRAPASGSSPAKSRG